MADKTGLAGHLSPLSQLHRRRTDTATATLSQNDSRVLFGRINPVHDRGRPVPDLGGNTGPRMGTFSPGSYSRPSASGTALVIPGRHDDPRLCTVYSSPVMAMVHSQVRRFCHCRGAAVVGRERVLPRCITVVARSSLGRLVIAEAFFPRIPWSPSIAHRHESPTNADTLLHTQCGGLHTLGARDTSHLRSCLRRHRAGCDILLLQWISVCRSRGDRTPGAGHGRARVERGDPGCGYG